MPQRKESRDGILFYWILSRMSIWISYVSGANSFCWTLHSCAFSDINVRIFGIILTLTMPDMLRQAKYVAHMFILLKDICRDCFNVNINLSGVLQAHMTMNPRQALGPMDAVHPALQTPTLFQLVISPLQINICKPLCHSSNMNSNSSCNILMLTGRNSSCCDSYVYLCEECGL
jgi:hypothetical protein